MNGRQVTTVSSLVSTAKFTGHKSIKAHLRRDADQKTIRFCVGKEVIQTHWKLESLIFTSDRSAIWQGDPVSVALEVAYFEHHPRRSNLTGISRCSKRLSFEVLQPNPLRFNIFFPERSWQGLSCWEPNPCHKAVAKFTISKFSSPWDVETSLSTKRRPEPSASTIVRKTQEFREDATSLLQAA